VIFSPGENALPTVYPTNASKIDDISVKTCHVQLFHIFNRNNCTKRPIYATVGLFFSQQLQNARSGPKYKRLIATSFRKSVGKPLISLNPYQIIRDHLITF
jgi:hypothetical protein